MLISIVFLLVLNPLPSLQDTLREKNDTAKAIDQIVSHNVPKLVTTPLTTKAKNRTQAASSKSNVDQSLSSTPKPIVDGVQKPVPSLQDTLREKKNSTAKSRVNTIKPVTTLSNTKMINQTQSTSSKSSSISQTLPSKIKPGDKKHGPTKSTANTSSLNVPNVVTTTLNTKNQTHPTSSKTSNTNQTLPSTAKHLVDESTVSEKKNSSKKNEANVLPTTTLHTKVKNQTQSTSSKSSNQHQDPVQKHLDQVSEKKNVKSKSIKVVTTLLNLKRKGQAQTTSLTSSKVNQTLPSSPKPDVDTIQKPVQSVQNAVSEKKNSSNKSINVQKPIKSKINNQTQSTSFTSSKVNQTLPSSTKPEVETAQKPVESVQNAVGEKKSSSNKSINVQKPIKSKINNQTQSTSFASSSKVNQTLPSSTKHEVETAQKPVESVQNAVSEKKSSSNKSINVQKPIKSKLNNQTQSTSFASSKVNQTLPSSTKPGVETIQKPVENTVSDKENSTSKSTVNTINVQKPSTTLVKTKTKHQTQSTSTKNSSIDQTLSSITLKPVVDVVQKTVSSLPTTEKKNTSTKSISHNINVNALNPLNTKIKSKTHLTTPKPSQVNQTLSTTPKPAVDVQKPRPGEKNSTHKSKNRHNVPKLTTSIDMKNQTQPTSSKINQTVPSTTKTKKTISSNKTTSQTINDNISKPITTSINTKTKNQTQSTSSKLSNVNQTLPSATKLDDDDESKLIKKNNTTVQSPFQTNIGDASKTSINGKKKNQTQSTSPKTSQVDQTVTFTPKPVVPLDDVHYPMEDKPVESLPIKIVITEGCVHKDSQTDTRNMTKVRETELRLNPGSPLVMTHRINLVQGVCAGDCETQMATLRDRVEFLEKEMSAIKKMCIQCSGDQCPKNCSGQGKCEEGKCVCFQGFSGPDCSGKVCPSNCNKKGNCVKGKCVCQTGYTGPDCSKAVDKKIAVTVETVTVKMSTAKPGIKSVTTKPDKTLLVKKDPKKDIKTKPMVKPIPTVSTDNVQTNTTKKDLNVKTVGEVLLNHGGRRRQEQTKGKTEIIKLGKTDLKDKSKIIKLKDEPINHNKGSSDAQLSKTKVTTRNASDQGRETKTNVTSTGKEKKAFHGNSTIQAEKDSERHENGTSIDSKTHDNKTSSRLSAIGSVELHNITSTSFIMSWEAPRDTFKNFTVTRRERNEDSGKIQSGTIVENVTDVQSPGSNRTSVKVHTSKLEETSGKKFSQVLAGTARSYHFKGLQPQTRYSVFLFGSGVGIRSKIHRLTLSTGPEPPTDLLFSNISETSVSVSWTKPKSVVTEFKVMYTNTANGESGSMSVDSQLSHVLLSKLSPGSTYDITVSSVLETLKSEPVTASVTTVPDPPTELKVVNITDTKALLAWKPSQAKVDSYILSYGTTKSPNVTITVTLSGRTVEHQLRGLHRSSLYMVKITSQVNRLQSSPVASTFTTGSGVKLQAVSPGEVTFHSAVISWKAPRVPFKSYRLTYQLSEDIREVILNPSVTHYELTGLAASSNYTVKVDGERDGQYIGFVSAEFTTAQLPHPYPTDCSEVQINGMKESGEAEIYPEGQDGEPVWVYCDMETDGGGWTVFQRRMDGSTDFYRSWRDYSKGFGYLSEEFWLGNDIIHTLTSLAPMSLRIDLRSGNDTAFAHYADFSVSSEANHYTIKLSGYSGTAGDSMKYHNGRPFSTKDKDPDILSIHCAKAYMGGWWYKNCYKANLNGLYASYSDNKGVVWIDWKGKDASLPFTEMKLRPSYFSQTVLTTPTTQG